MTDDQLDLEDPRWNDDQAALRDYVRITGESEQTGRANSDEIGDVPAAENAQDRSDSE